MSDLQQLREEIDVELDRINTDSDTSNYLTGRQRDSYVDAIMSKIAQHDKYVIGVDLPGIKAIWINEEKAEQRRRAGLKEENL